MELKFGFTNSSETEHSQFTQQTVKYFHRTFNITGNSKSNDMKSIGTFLHTPNTTDKAITYSENMA